MLLLDSEVPSRPATVNAAAAAAAYYFVRCAQLNVTVKIQALPEGQSLPGTCPFEGSTTSDHGSSSTICTACTADNQGQCKGSTRGAYTANDQGQYKGNTTGACTADDQAHYKGSTSTGTCTADDLRQYSSSMVQSTLTGVAPSGVYATDSVKAGEALAVIPLRLALKADTSSNEGVLVSFDTASIWFAVF